LPITQFTKGEQMTNCLHCGLQFVAKRNKKFCSDRCGRNNYKKRNVAKKRFYPKQCRKCKKEFVSDIAHLAGIPSKHLGYYCSNDCKESSLRAQQSKHTHQRRSKLKGGDSIDLYELADKSQWMCALCNQVIDKNNKHYRHNTNLQGPSIDHIIPISKGGKHTWDNVQLAHLICNSLRGNKELIAQ
jgi:5-methylcytosine-specific restriction endonuclease McrA